MLSTWTFRTSLTNSQLIRHHPSSNLHLLQSASYFRLGSANTMAHVLSRHLLLQPHWILDMVHCLLVIILRPPSSLTSIPNFTKIPSNLASLPRFPFYAYLRLFLLSYLVLPQTQGARLLYQSYIQPFLAQHEADIDIFISHARNRARAIGLQYLKRAMDFIKENLLRLQPIAQAFPSTSGDESESE